MRTNKNRLETIAANVLLGLIMLGALEVAQRVLELADLAEALPARAPPKPASVWSSLPLGSSIWMDRHRQVEEGQLRLAQAHVQSRARSA